MTIPLTLSHWPTRPAPLDRRVTVGRALVTAAKTWPQRTALIEGSADLDGRSWSFAELLDASRAVAHALLTRFAPGERIALWATNRPEWLLLQFGAALAGLTLVTVNPAYGAGELDHVLRRSRVAGVVVEPHVRSRDLREICEEVAAGLPDIRTVDSLDGWADIPVGPDTKIALPDVSADQPAQIQYTSGTTGSPKGALLAHRGLVLNGRLFADAIGARAGDVWLNPMPLFHTAGCVLATLGALQTGGTQILPPAFDPDLMLDLVERFDGSVLLSVPTMLIRMLDAQAHRPRRLDRWRLSALGGAPVSPALVERAEQALGVTVAIGFGQTECSPYITHTMPDDPHPNWSETVGRPLPLVEVKIAAPETDAPTPIGTAGEICTRGDCVMLEYFDDPEATAATIDGDRWLHTGDIGTMDDEGYVRVVGRSKDLIIRGGENVYPREVEDVLAAHPAIIEASVVGIPDDEWGEVVVAFVRLRAGLEVDPSELESYCRGQIAGYKVPRTWVFVSELPQTASGKVQKFVLRDRYLAARADGGDGAAGVS